MAAYNAEEIKRLAYLLAGNVKMKMDYAAVANKNRKILLVEGGTDVSFVNNIKTNTVDCLSADNIFNSNASFRTTTPKRVNSKNAIVQLILGISKYPSPFIAYPDDVDKWDLYGLVDLDCDELDAGASLSRLFITDTHDMETLIMSTDKNVFKNIDSCTISDEAVSKAYFVAYQLAKTRELLKDHYNNKTFDLRVISCGSQKVDFSLFVHDCKINIVEMSRYIAQNSENILSLQKINQLIDKILREKGVRKKFTLEGMWKQEISTFESNSIDDFWTSVNGHDVLQLIRHYSAEAEQVFGSDSSNNLNRKFELEIIKKYDYSAICSTQLYKKMKEHEIVN